MILLEIVHYVVISLKMLLLRGSHGDFGSSPRSAFERITAVDAC
jgi:hypothetical protein